MTKKTKKCFLGIFLVLVALFFSQCFRIGMPLDEALQEACFEKLDGASFIDFSELDVHFDRMLVLAPYVDEEELIQKGLRVDKLAKFSTPITESTTIVFMRGQKIVSYINLDGASTSFERFQLAHESKTTESLFGDASVSLY